MYVCGLHFTKSDYSPTTGRKHLKRGIISLRFKWNNWGSVHQKLSNVPEKIHRQNCSGSENNNEQLAVNYGPAPHVEHNYPTAPITGLLDGAAERIRD